MLINKRMSKIYTIEINQMQMEIIHSALKSFQAATPYAPPDAEKAEELDTLVEMSNLSNVDGPLPSPAINGWCL